MATPIPVHRDQSIAALEAGCHVLQEVTLANTIDACRDIVRAVEAHPKQKFMMGGELLLLGPHPVLGRDVAAGPVRRLHLRRGRVRARHPLA